MLRDPPYVVNCSDKHAADCEPAPSRFCVAWMANSFSCLRMQEETSVRGNVKAVWAKARRRVGAMSRHLLSSTIGFTPEIPTRQ